MTVARASRRRLHAARGRARHDRARDGDRDLLRGLPPRASARVERGEVAVVTAQRLRAASDVLIRQIKSIVPYSGAQRGRGRRVPVLRRRPADVDDVRHRRRAAGRRRARPRVLRGRGRSAAARCSTESPYFSPDALGSGDATTTAAGRTPCCSTASAASRFEYLVRDDERGRSEMAPRGTRARTRSCPPPCASDRRAARVSRSTPGGRRSPSWPRTTARAARSADARADRRAAGRRESPTGARRRQGGEHGTSRQWRPRRTTPDERTTRRTTMRRGVAPPARHRAPPRALGVHDPRRPGARLRALHARRRHGRRELRRGDAGLLRGGRRHATARSAQATQAATGATPEGGSATDPAADGRRGARTLRPTDGAVARRRRSTARRYEVRVDRRVRPHPDQRAGAASEPGRRRGSRLPEADHHQPAARRERRRGDEPARRPQDVDAIVDSIIDWRDPRSPDGRTVPRATGTAPTVATRQERASSTRRRSCCWSAASRRPVLRQRRAPGLRDIVSVFCRGDRADALNAKTIDRARPGGAPRARRGRGRRA